MSIKLSICCITYNHANFIRQALDGFLMQKTNFDYEILIHDDASTDGTADIIREYAAKYPNLIKPILQKENLCSQGKNISKCFVFPLIKGEYVALCEGDDYWTDEYKLQKQVDFLDSHPDYSICFHPVRKFWQDGSRPDEIFPKPAFRFHKTTLGLEELLHHNFMQTNSVVYRWGLKDKLNLIPDGIMPADYYLHLLHAQMGKIGFLPDVMGAYRKHEGGVWYEAETTDRWYLKNTFANLAFFKNAEKQFNCDKKELMIRAVSDGIYVFLKNKRWKDLQKLEQEYPEIYKAVFDRFTIKSFSLQKEYKEKCKKLKKIIVILACLCLISIVVF